MPLAIVRCRCASTFLRIFATAYHPLLTRLGGSRQNKAYLGEHWSAAGFICVFMQHAGSDLRGDSTGEATATIQGSRSSRQREEQF